MNFLVKNHIEMIYSGQNTPIMEYVMVEHKVYVLKYTFLILKTIWRENWTFPILTLFKMLTLNEILSLKMALK